MRSDRHGRQAHERYRISVLILFLVITLVADSSVFSVEKDGIKPSVKWSDKTYANAW